MYPEEVIVPLATLLVVSAADTAVAVDAAAVAVAVATNRITKHEGLTDLRVSFYYPKATQKPKSSII